MKRILCFVLAMIFILPMLFACKKDEIALPASPKGPIFDLTKEERETFSNYIDLDGEMIGDPFIMRYDGKYYLYPSQSSNKPWYVYVSEDLVNWSEKIECVPMSEIPSGVNENDVYCDAMGAYAPEVTYYNGKFIMVTAPGATGHRFFVSDSPTGPFKQMEGNYNRKIDGSIFIDNDGQWYFYSASGSGIKVYKMLSSTSIGSEIATLSQMYGRWTEGPMVVYHDGTYFMTYTGNHVHNTAYRVPYSVSTTVPTRFNEPDGNNILLLNTSGEIVATGHSSTVKAPNLDAYYIAYHCYLPSGGRRLAIDRIVFDGTTMDVFGPTAGDQHIPEMPDIYAFFDEPSDAAIFENVAGAVLSDGKVKLNAGGKLITKNALSGDKYTIEVTTADMSAGAKAGAIFAYSDENNYASAVFNSTSEMLVVTFVENGKATTYTKALVRSFNEAYDFSATQTIQIEKKGSTFTFYVNDRELCKYESTLAGTKLGLICESGSASFGYLGASDEVGGSSNCDYYKPVGDDSGVINATLCTEKDAVERGYDVSDNSSYLVAKADESYNYLVYAEKEGLYTFGVKYRADEETVLDIYVNGNLADTVTLKGGKTDYATASSAKKLALSEGENVITVYARSGKADIKSYTVLYTELQDMNLNFDTDIKEGFIYTDGVNWECAGGRLRARSIGKRLYGNEAWSDYTLECEVYLSDTIDFGLLFRTKNAAENGKFVDGTDYSTKPTVEGSSEAVDWLQGYYLHFENNKVTLEKCNYSTTDLVSGRINTEGVKKLKVGIVCNGANIQVYIGGTLVIDYTDPDPYLTGAVGMRLASGTGSIDNLEVVAIKGQ